MLDMKYILEETETVRKMLRDREKDVDLDRLIEVYKQLNDVKKSVEKLRKTRNSSSENINKIKKQGGDASEIIAGMKKVVKQLKELEPELDKLQKEYDSLRYQLPNKLDNRVPRGNEDRVEFEGGTIPKFDFEAKSNWDVLTDLGLADFKRGIKAAGDRGWVLNGNGARLSRAITTFLLDFWRAKGYKEVLPPFFVNEENLYITGHYPGGEEEVYRTEDGKVFVGDLPYGSEIC